MTTDILSTAELSEMTLPETVEDVHKSVSALSLWLSRAGSSILKFLLHAAVCLLIYILIRKILNLLLTMLGKYMTRRHVEPTVQHFITSLLRYAVLGFTVVSIIVELQIVQAASVAALIASAGVGISLAMQGALSNFAGGLLLLILKPFRVGDYIIVTGSSVEGTVTKVELYYTTIRALNGSTTVIPNAELTNHSVQNLSSHHQKFLVVKVGISYQQDIEQAKRILENIQANETRYIPGTTGVIVDELGANAVLMAVRGLVDSADYYPVMWSLNETILTRFAEEGIEIPYNQLDVHVISNTK